MDVTPATPRRRSRRRLAAVFAASAVALAIPLTSGSPQAAAAGLTPFDDCAALDEWFTDAARPLVGAWGWQFGGFGGIEDTAAGATEGADGARAVTATSTAEAVGQGATGTNLQEVGVDEPDLVKTDGELLLAVTAGTLHVVDVGGDSPRRLARLEVPQQWTGELLMLGDRALIIGQRDGAAFGGDTPVSSEPMMAPGGDIADFSTMPAMPSSTVLTVVDLSDPAAPTVVRTDEVEAGYLSAREVAGTVRVVLTSVPSLPFVQPEIGNGGMFDEGAAIARNLDVLEAAGPEDWLPQRVVRDSGGVVIERAPAIDCTAVSHPGAQSGVGVITVLTLDGGAPDVPTVDTDAISADGNLVYSSADRLYVATTSGGWGWGGPMAADGPVRMGLPGDGGTATTQLHGFDTSAERATDYVASGSVDGWLMGRWAMSARDGMLRVATTRDLAVTGQDTSAVPAPEVVEPAPAPGTDVMPVPPAERPVPVPATDAAVTILAERGDTLEIVGTVGGLGRGEQIRAVRWFDDLAVVVTFRQTDPLYTVDLSEPTAPRVVGELKIPGYSAYLHPLGDGMLLGVGQDADPQTGMTLGAQVSTFDLRDLGAPAQVDVVRYPSAYTEVEGDSRHFSYLPNPRQAIMPMQGPQGSSLRAISVGADGTLTESGSWTPGRDAWLLRAVPVSGDRWAAISEGVSGPVLTLLSTDLGALGEVKLAG